MPLSLAHLTPARRDMLAIMQAALDAADPFHAVTQALQRDGASLRVGGQRYNLDQFERVWLLGAGKAGASMARAAEAVLGDRLAGGVVVVKDGHAAPLEHVTLYEAAHPVPNNAALVAGAAIQAQAAAATANDLLLFVLSGGGSALLEVLPAPLTLADLQATTDALLRSGATINEMNTLRKHLSAVKGGQLARTVAPATLVTLVLSDVVGSPLDAIASGPTVPDPSTWQDVQRIVERYGLAERLPPPVLARIAQGLSGDLPDTPKAGDPLFQRTQTLIVADNGQAAEAAARAAQQRGYHPLLLTTFLQGEAREVATVAVAVAQEVQARARPVPRPACLILGGETTVTLTGAGGAVGRGGRNQELALAAALHLAAEPGILLGALATDGSDGPTDSAGAVVDSGTVARALAQGQDPAAALARHDAYPLLDATGDLLRSGPTLTNVNDLLLLLVP